jgi:glycosyltransferase involved in cell wall biosynthesis
VGKIMSELNISVVLPVYNAEKYLDEAIKSILNQTYTNFEFIIINDGSTDSSLEIIKKYKNQDDRIILITRENRGLIASLNEGIEQSKGKFIARMDADDISLPTRFKKQVTLMENNDIDICGCHFSMINKDGKYLKTIYCPLNNDSLLLFLTLIVPFAHGSVMINKRFLIHHNLKYGQNENKNSEDKALWVSMYNKDARFDNVNEVLFEYREFNESLSKLNGINLRNDNKKVKLELINNHYNTIKEALISLSKRINQLSYIEIEFLADLSLFLFWYKKDFKYLKLLKKVPFRYKIISFLKFLKF